MRALALLLVLAGCARAGDEPKPEAPRVTVSGWRWDFDAVAPGFCKGRGYVRNGGNAVIANVRLVITFYDAANSAVATGELPTDKPALTSGELSSFDFALPCPAGSESAELKATHGRGEPLAVTMRD